jgi:hypothetical protein
LRTADFLLPFLPGGESRSFPPFFERILQFLYIIRTFNLRIALFLIILKKMLKIAARTRAAAFRPARIPVFQHFLDATRNSTEMERKL